MPVKKTKKVSLETSKVVKKKWSSKTTSKEGVENNDVKKDVKKVFVKRRKVELKPTKASAVAIVSQANRAKKMVLIEKVSNSDLPVKKIEPLDKKIPLWVWIFFGCSLILFCVSFYQAIIRPQIEKENIVVNEDIYRSGQNINGIPQELEDKNDSILGVDQSESFTEEEKQIEKIPVAATDTIEQFFDCLSDRDFEWAFDLMIPVLKNNSDIRAHFTSYRMNPFLDWIEWWRLIPENLKYLKSQTYWKDVYNFDLSYVLISNQEKYEETWEFTVNTQQEYPLISGIRCISSRCSYHPIFWPENFGLMD